MRTWLADRARPLSVVVTLVVLAAAVAVGYVVLNSTKMKQASIYFPSTIGIYKGTSVRLLGVPVGKVTSVKPMGTTVLVKVSYKASTQLPADVGVAQVPPSIVSDRFLQFDETYVSGPELADHATIQADKTEVPVELDQIFGSINDLNVALGPNGANKSGALSQLVDVGAANLRGNGAQFNATLKGFSAAINTLSNSRDALFGTITSLQKFTTTLANDDAGVRTINGQLSQVSAQLAGERTDLGAAFANLATALTQVQSFVADNKDTLTHDITGLTQVTSGLLTQKQAIKEILDEAPDALYNLVLTFNPTTTTCDANNRCTQGALVTRADNTSDPSYLLCSLLTSGLSSLPTPVTGLTTQTCSSAVGQLTSASSTSAPAAKAPTTTTAPTVPTVPSVPAPEGLVGGLLNGATKALGGGSGSSGSGGSTGSGGTGSCTGLLCGILGGGAQ